MPAAEGETPAAFADHATAETGNGHEANGDGANITEVSGTETNAEDEVIELVGGADAMEEVPERAHAPAANTRSRKSSSAGRSCWCRWSRKSAAPRARR